MIADLLGRLAAPLALRLDTPAFEVLLAVTVVVIATAIVTLLATVAADAAPVGGARSVGADGTRLRPRSSDPSAPGHALARAPGAPA